MIIIINKINMKIDINKKENNKKDRIKSNKYKIYNIIVIKNNKII